MSERHLPLSDVARELCCSVRGLQQWVKGATATYRPKLRSVILDGKVCVEVHEAYEHLLKYGKKLTRLRAPRDCEAAAEIEPIEAGQVLSASDPQGALDHLLRVSEPGPRQTTF